MVKLGLYAQEILVICKYFPLIWVVVSINNELTVRLKNRVAGSKESRQNVQKFLQEDRM